MAEQNGAELTKVQLHLRVRPELARLIDAYRGPATRNAYAAMILEYELKRRHNDAHETMTAIADRALLDHHDPVRAGWELASGLPAEELEEAAKLYLLLRNASPRLLTAPQVDDLLTTFG